MKCICPMSSGQECPSTCTPTARAKYRKKLACEYYRNGMTQAEIAIELGISQPQVSLDLETLLKTDNVKGQGKDTLGRTKSTGRPKGRRMNTSESAKAAAEQILSGKSYPKVEAETGLSNTVLRAAVAREEGRREPKIELTDLSLSQQQKNEIWRRQEKARLNAEFDRAVYAKAQERFDEIWLPDLKKKVEEAQEIYNRRKGWLGKEAFNMIRRALHPDSRHSISDRRLGEAFDAFMALEKYLLDEKDSPTNWPTIPRSYEEMMAARAAVRKKNSERGKRAATNSNANQVTRR